MDCYLAAALKRLHQSVLVIGYGNLLRSDDGIGQQIAQDVASWGMPNVEAIAVHQLTPELAETLAMFDMVIFIDACWMSDDQDIQVEQIKSSSHPITGHVSDPRSLLGLTQTLYDRIPQAWWVMVPGVNFGVGDCLSSVAEQNRETALQTIERLIQPMRTQPCMKSE
jgi:hydrogenase maturation protease